MRTQSSGPLPAAAAASRGVVSDSQRADAWRRYVAGLAHFGLSPSSRGKVQVAAPVDPASKGSKYFA